MKHRMTQRTGLLVLVVSVFLLIPSWAVMALGPTDTTVLTNCTVIDATGSPPLENAVVVIVGNRISAVHSEGNPNPDLPDGAQVVDLHGGYVLPGLWNNHTHLGDLLPDPYE